MEKLKMKMGIFSIKDLKSGYQQIFLSANEAVAMRDFGSICNKPDTQYNNFPTDYELWKVGEFDTETGISDVSQGRLVSATAYVKTIETDVPANAQ